MIMYWKYLPDQQPHKMRQIQEKQLGTKTSSCDGDFQQEYALRHIKYALGMTYLKTWDFSMCC